jgi:hypothetical protein
MSGARLKTHCRSRAITRRPDWLQHLSAYSAITLHSAGVEYGGHHSPEHRARPHEDCMGTVLFLRNVTWLSIFSSQGTLFRRVRFGIMRGDQIGQFQAPTTTFHAPANAYFSDDSVNSAVLSMMSHPT